MGEGIEQMKVSEWTKPPKSSLERTFGCIPRNNKKWLVEHDKRIRAEVIDEITEKYFDAIEDTLHQTDLKLDINQSLSIYARILNRCNGIAEEMKEQKK